MIQEKGIDPIAVDKIGKYVELKGTTNVLFLFKYPKVKLRNYFISSMI